MRDDSTCHGSPFMDSSPLSVSSLTSLSAVEQNDSNGGLRGLIASCGEERDTKVSGPEIL